MKEDLSEARRSVRRAARAVDDRELRVVLESIDEGLVELVDGDKTREDPDAHAERLHELEQKLDGVSEHVDGKIHDHVSTARKGIESYRERREDLQ